VLLASPTFYKDWDVGESEGIVWSFLSNHKGVNQ
jgi:hypothetical protein